MPVSDMYDYNPHNDMRSEGRYQGSGPGSDYGSDWVEPRGQAPPPAGAPPPPPSQPRPEPMSRPPRPRRSGPMLSPSAGAMIVILGVLIFFVGSIILQTSVLVEPPEDEDFDDIDDSEKRYKKEEEAEENYDDTMRNMIGVGKVLNWLGSMFIVLPLYLIGISNQELDWKVRASMLSTATAIVIAVIIVTMFFGLSPIY